MFFHNTKNVKASVLLLSSFIWVMIFPVYAGEKDEETEKYSLDQSHYDTYSSFDKKIVCRINNNRNEECNLDFDVCKEFTYSYDYYMIVYGLTGLSGVITGDTDAKRQQEIQKKSQELIRLAQQNGVKDINMIAYSAIDQSAQDELSTYKAKQAFHISFLAYLQQMTMRWKDEKSGYQSSTCSIQTSDYVRGLAVNPTDIRSKNNSMGCFASPADFSSGVGCVEEELLGIKDVNFFSDKNYAGNYLKCQLKPELMKPPFDCAAIINSSPLVDEKVRNFYNNIVTSPLKSSFSNEEIPTDSCENYHKTINLLFNKSKLFQFVQATDITRQRCEFKITKNEHPFINIPGEESVPYGVNNDLKVNYGSYDISIKACKHLCDTDVNFFAYVAPNIENKQHLLSLINQVTGNLNELNAKIKSMEALRSKLASDKKEYEDYMKNQGGGTADGGGPTAQDCANNPLLAGCVNYNNFQGNRNQSNGNRNNRAVPTAKTPDQGSGYDKTSALKEDKKDKGPSPATGGGGGASEGGGRPGSDLGASSVQPGSDEEKDKDLAEESSQIDMQGVQEYGAKGKKGISTGGVGGSGNGASGKSKKVQNPFEELFGKKQKKSDELEKTPRDIASANEEEDSENGFSNLFTRITKTYQKKFSEGIIGDKNSLRFK